MYIINSINQDVCVLSRQVNWINKIKKNSLKTSRRFKWDVYPVSGVRVQLDGFGLLEALSVHLTVDRAAVRLLLHGQGHLKRSMAHSETPSSRHRALDYCRWCHACCRNAWLSLSACTSWGTRRRPEHARGAAPPPSHDPDTDAPLITHFVLPFLLLNKDLRLNFCWVLPRDYM